MKETKKAQKVMTQIDQFVRCFTMAKGRQPSVIHLSKQQSEDLGVEDGEKVKGINIEVLK